MRAPPEKTQTAPVAGRGGGDRHSGSSIREHPLKPSLPAIQAAIFTARPTGRWWSVAAISHAGEAVKLGIFPHRRDALSAAAVMARACGGAWCP